MSQRRPRPGSGSARRAALDRLERFRKWARTGPSPDGESLTTRSRPSSRCTSSTGLPGSLSTSQALRRRVAARGASAIPQPFPCRGDRPLPTQPRKAPPGRAGPAARLRGPRYRELDRRECLEQGESGEFELVLADDDGMREIGCRAPARRRGAGAVPGRLAGSTSSSRAASGSRHRPSSPEGRALLHDGRGRGHRRRGRGADRGRDRGVPRRLPARRQPPPRPISEDLDFDAGLDRLPDRRPRGLRHRGQAGPPRAPPEARARPPPRPRCSTRPPRPCSATARSASGPPATAASYLSRQVTDCYLSIEGL